MALSIVKDLVERRVPQYLAIYLGASWAIIEFFALLEDRFLLSPHLTNLVLAGLVLLVPSVVLVTYFHGRKGPDEWSRLEKVFVPLNLLVAIVILFAGFTGKDPGAVTTRVTVEDEKVNVLGRAVAKSEFRKRVAFFSPRSCTSATTSWPGSTGASIARPTRSVTSSESSRPGNRRIRGTVRQRRRVGCWRI